jgi:hypothetical protein
VMGGLAGLDVGHDDIMRITRILTPYLRSVAKYLGVPKRKKQL